MEQSLTKGKTSDVSIEREERKRLLAQRLKQKMKAKKINNVTFAQLVNRTPSEISKWLSGSHNFTIDTLFEIEDKLGVNLINVNEPTVSVVGGFRTARPKVKSAMGVLGVSKTINVVNTTGQTKSKEYVLPNRNLN